MSYTERLKTSVLSVRFTELIEARSHPRPRGAGVFSLHCINPNMVEKVLATVRGILFDEFPKNGGNTLAVVYDRPIDNWFVGDRKPVPDALSIIISGKTLSSKDVAYGMSEYEYDITIKAVAGGSNKDAAESNVQEMGRLITTVLRNHRRVWIMDPCPLCGKAILSPAHYISDHNNIVGSYVTTAVTEFNAEWATTHTAPPPTLPTSGQAVRGLRKLWDAVLANPSDPSLPAALTSGHKQQIASYAHDLVFPVRLMYDFKLTSGTMSNTVDGKELFHIGEYTYKGKEIVVASSFGPDNVNVGAIS